MGEWLVGASGVLVVVSLFLPWFDQRVQCVRAPCPPIERTGWESFAVTDVIMVVIAAGAVGVLFIAALLRSASPAIAYEAMLTLIATAAFAIVVIRVLSPPFDVSGRGAGAWLGLLSCAGVVTASMVAMRDERPSRPGHPTDSGGAPVNAPREVETISSPPATSS